MRHPAFRAHTHRKPRVGGKRKKIIRQQQSRDEDTQFKKPELCATLTVAISRAGIESGGFLRSNIGFSPRVAGDDWSYSESQRVTGDRHTYKGKIEWCTYIQLQ
ncbi:hypothetical protein MRX96_054793 [Rhipicephalus microplus]